MASLDRFRRLEPARITTFQNALEQAEQQFRAAARIGYESRALNLFYGLSQAGRAIAAAALVLGDSAWRLSGHGVFANPDRMNGDWQTLTSQPDMRRGGSFITLSRLLSSGVSSTVTLGDLWPLLPEASTLGPPVAGLQHPPLFTTLGLTMDIKQAGRATLHINVPKEARATAQRGQVPLTAWLDRYPSFDGWSPMAEPRSAPPVWPQEHVGLELYRDLVEGEDGSRAGLAERFQLYRGQRMAFPRLGAEAEARHPLMIWWAVLHGLSMLTRYAPDQWARAIEIDTPGSATRIEVLLDAALQAVPDLIDEAIASVLP